MDRTNGHSDATVLEQRYFPAEGLDISQEFEVEDRGEEWVWAWGFFDLHCFHLVVLLGQNRRTMSCPLGLLPMCCWDDWWIQGRKLGREQGVMV